MHHGTVSYKGISDKGLGGMEFQMDGVILSDRDNYLIH
jgi:hypothetical protein